MSGNKKSSSSGGGCLIHDSLTHLSAIPFLAAGPPSARFATATATATETTTTKTTTTTTTTQLLPPSDGLALEAFRLLQGVPNLIASAQRCRELEDIALRTFPRRAGCRNLVLDHVMKNYTAAFYVCVTRGASWRCDGCVIVLLDCTSS